MSRNGKFLFGALVGAIFGLAFAPKKGSELRQELKSELDKGGHGGKTLQKNVTVMGEDIATTAQEVYHDPKVQKQIKIGQKEAGKIIDKAKENIQKEAVKAFDTLKKSSTKARKPAASKTTAKTKKGKSARK